MWLSLAIIAATIIAFAWERYSIEAISLASLSAVLLLFTAFPYPSPSGGGLIDARQILSGFANPALITILSLLIVGQALFQTDALDRPSQFISRLARRNRWLAITGIYLVAGIISAFMNNTPVVVMFIPLLSALAASERMSPARVLMPLSFISILGGMTTLIGSSTNLLVAGVAERAGVPVGFFDITAMGAMIAAIGALYAIFVMPSLLADRETMADELRHGAGKHFIAQISITDTHPLNGAKAIAGMFPDLKDMTVRLVQRRQQPLLPPFDEITLKPGDVVVVAATRAALTRALSSREKLLQPDEEQDEDITTPPPSDFTLAEVIIPPGSRMIRRTVVAANIHADTECVVLGIQRRARMPRMSISDIRLETGDVLLVGGSRADIVALRSNRDMLVVDFSAADVPMRSRAPYALMIFAAMILTAATGLLPIVTSALLATLAMIATGCINIRQAARAIDGRILMLIAASLASATALEATGGAEFIALGVVSLLDGAPPAVLLSALFLLIATLTNILSNNATAVLFTPIALNIATQTGLPVEPFIIAVILAANCSFITPIGYQTNLLVMGPGHYRFGDFVKAGLPLALLVWITFSLLAPWYYGLI